jgi:hypothetical protein
MFAVIKPAKGVVVAIIDLVELQDEELDNC